MLHRLQGKWCSGIGMTVLILISPSRAILTEEDIRHKDSGGAWTGNGIMNYYRALLSERSAVTLEKRGVYSDACCRSATGLDYWSGVAQCINTQQFNVTCVGYAGTQLANPITCTCHEHTRCTADINAKAVMPHTQVIRYRGRKPEFRYHPSRPLLDASCATEYDIRVYEAKIVSAMHRTVLQNVVRAGSVAPPDSRTEAICMVMDAHEQPVSGEAQLSISVDRVKYQETVRSWYVHARGVELHDKVTCEALRAGRHAARLVLMYVWRKGHES